MTYKASMGGPTLRLRPIDDPKALNLVPAVQLADILLGVGYELWLFLDHGGGERQLLDERWAIGHRRRDDWWGAVALAADTHEGALEMVAAEMALAREAIQQLRGKPAAGIPEEPFEKTNLAVSVEATDAVNEAFRLLSEEGITPLMLLIARVATKGWQMGAIASPLVTADGIDRVIEALRKVDVIRRVDVT